MNVPTTGPSTRDILAYWVPAAALPALIYTVPNFIAIGQGGLPAPTGTNDLSLHAGAYFLVCLLWWRAFHATGGPRLARWASPAAFAVAVVLGAIDEAIQALPVLPRNPTFSDLLFDAIGAAAAAAAAWEIARLARRRRTSDPPAPDDAASAK